MTRTTTSPVEVRTRRLALRSNGGRTSCVADYHLVDGVMRTHHTAVPRALTGRGIAARLVQAALAYAAANDLEVEPWCSYVRTYIKRNPEAQALLPDGFRL